MKIVTYNIHHAIGDKSIERQLATTLYADVAGYSRFTQMPGDWPGAANSKTDRDSQIKSV